MPVNLDFQRYSLNKRAAAAGDLNGLIAHLFTNAFTPGGFNQSGDFTEANFDGYAASAALTWNLAINRTTGDYAEIQSMPANFVAADASVVQGIVGFFLTNPTGGSPLGVHLMGSFVFPVPVNIAHAGDGVNLTVIIGYDGSISANLG